MALDAVAQMRAVGRRNRVSVLGVLGGRLGATHWTLVLNGVATGLRQKGGVNRGPNSKHQPFRRARSLGMKLVGNEKTRLNRNQLIEKAKADLASF